MPKMKRIHADPHAIVARPEFGDGVVKSAGRVLEILEFFDDIRRSATVVEVSEALGYPQSSTSALLRSLVKLGYLKHDPYARTYGTSVRVALLGSWVSAEFVREGRVIEMMKELNRLTRDTIILAVRNGLYSQYVHVIQAVSSARYHITLGTVRPLAASGAGHTQLSMMRDQDIVRFVMRINAQANDESKLVKISELLPKIHEIRQNGYSFSVNSVTQGGGILAAPLPLHAGEQPMVVGIGGISEVMIGRKQELVDILLSSIDRYLGPHTEGEVIPLSSRAIARA